MKSFLFMGGPYHGTERAIANPLDTIRVAVMKPPGSMFADDKFATEPMCDYKTYTLTKFSWVDNGIPYVRVYYQFDFR